MLYKSSVTPFAAFIVAIISKSGLMQNQPVKKADAFKHLLLVKLFFIYTEC